MQRHSTLLVSTVISVCLAGCASRSSTGPAIVRGLVLPTTTAFDGGLTPVTSQASSVRDTVVTGERPRIWDVLPSVFESLNIDAEMMDPTALVIGTERRRTARVAGNRLSAFLDCGGGVAAPNADSYDVMISLFVQLEEAEGRLGATRVRTVLDALAQSRYNQSDQIQCTSFGTLERRLVELIDLRLRNPSGVEARGPLRRPVAGDFVRMMCVARPEDPTSVRDGELLDFNGGAILFAPEGSNEQVVVPASNVLRLQIREERSRARVSALVGAAVGIAAGGVVGRSTYDRDDRSHYRPGVHMTIGAVLGAVGGAVLGGVIGSFVDYDTWVEGDLAFENVRSEAGPAAPAPTPSCPMPAAMAR